MQARRALVVRLRRWVRASEAAFILLAALVGCASALATLAQGWIAHGLQHLFYGVTINRLSALASIRHPWRLLALPMGGAAIVLFERIKRQRGIHPVDVVEANALHGGRIGARDNVVIAAETVVSNGCGASVGLEATYAQMGGGLASLAGQWLQLRRADLRTLVGAGAGAGVGAAFGAPLTGAFYAFEIVIGTYSLAAVTPVIAASLAGVLLLRRLGIEPYLVATTAARSRTGLDYGAAVVLGLASALLGVTLMRLVTAAERLFARITRGTAWRPVLGGLLMIPVALVSPQALSAGHGALHLDLVTRPPVATLLTILALKVLASAISLASGFRGGLFFASLFVGSLAGEAFAEAINQAGIGLMLDPTDFALVGMAALSVSVIGGPMTLALLMLETTHDFALMGVVLTAALVANAATRESFGYSFSTWRLHMRGSTIRSPRDIGWMTDLTAERLMRRDWMAVPDTLTIDEFRLAVPPGSTSKGILIDSAGRYRGIVPTAAAHSTALPGDEPVLALARQTTATLAPDSTIREILGSFDDYTADELAVTDREGRVVGVLSEHYARRRYLDALAKAERSHYADG